ncbi:MAG: ATP-binding protein, partial [Candidatus Jordarchaeaceae archaeon]
QNTKTIGIVTDIRSITDAESHLANVISRKIPGAEHTVERIGGLIAEAAVVRNIGYQVELRMPVPYDSEVYYADEESIKQAVGADLIVGKPIPAGITKQTSGVSAVIPLDSHYLLGPEAAHINISGISGLATKTSYLMFLLLSIYQKMREEVAFIIFNVKYSDLLHIHEHGKLSEEDKKLYEVLEIKPEPFPKDRFKYLLPRGEAGKTLSYEPPEDYNLYAFELNDVYDKMDLLFSEVPDPWGTIARFTTGLSRNWQRNRGITIGLSTVYTWEHLQNIDDDTFGHFFGVSPPAPQRIKAELNRLTKSPIFINERSQEKYLGDEIKEIEAGDIIVIDIFPHTLETRAFIIGIVMSTLEELYVKQPEKLPRKIILLIDELNEIAPRGKDTALSRMVVDIARKGRSRGTILFSAQQFKSQVDDQVHGNCGTHVVGRTGGSELQNPVYGFLDKSAKQDAMVLKQGELIVSFPTWRRPVKITFPIPPYKIPKR